MKAINKDITRTMKRSKRRFFSILTITALGVCMLSGLKAACDDLRYSADYFYDTQNLFDLSVVSTMGLNDDDIEALKSIAEIENVEAIYSEDVFTDLEDGSESVQVKTISKTINQPYLIKGRLPKNKDEIVVSEKYLKDTDKKVNDTIQFKNTQHMQNNYTISGVVQDASDVNNNDGAASFRSTNASTYVFFINQEAIHFPIYTNVYLKVKGANQLLCFSDEYKQLIKEVKKDIEKTIKVEREDQRDRKSVV